MVWRTLPRFKLTLPRCDGFELTLPVGGRSTDTLPRRRGTTVRPMAQVEFGCRPSSQRPALPTSLASCTPPHAPAQPPDNRTPPGAKFLCFISSLQRHALVCGENLEGGHIFHPRTVLLCGVCACTLCDLLRCVAGDERCRRNSARLTSLDDLGYRAGPPLTISGCGARRQPPPTHSADIAKGRTPGVDLTPPRAKSN